MKDSGKFKFVVIAAPVLAILGILGYRVMSGERKRIDEGGLLKGEEYDKTSVELGKTEIVDDNSDLKSVLISGQEEIQESFSKIIVKMMTQEKETYKDIVSVEEFRSVFTKKALNIYLANIEVISSVPRSGKSFEKLLKRIKLYEAVLNFIGYNQCQKRKTVFLEVAPKSSRQKKRGKKGLSVEIIKRPLNLGEFNLSLRRGGGS